MEQDPQIDPAAPHHLPSFITLPGQTDWLLNAMLVFLIFVVVSVGLIYLRLHALPEHMAHRTNKVQLQLVAVLALIALFTHNNIFWIIALVVAMLELPDFGTPLNRIAGSAEKLAGLPPGEGAVAAPGHADDVKPAEASSGTDASTRHADGPIPMHAPQEAGPLKPRGRAHA